MRHKSSRSTHRTNHQDILDDLENEVATPLGRPIPPVRLGLPVRKKLEIEDRRKWDPQPTARDVTGRHARIVHKVTAPKVRRGPGGKPLQSSVKKRVIRTLENAVPRFAEARKTIICFKRKARREVLHALKRTRSGKGSPKRRNEWSEVQC